MSKLADVLKKESIDARRLLVVSHKLEKLRPEDRAVKLARRRAKAGSENDKEQAAQTVRSGRPVRPPTLDAALQGKPISKGAQKRLTRAVNAVLEQKGKGAQKLSASDLF